MALDPRGVVRMPELNAERYEEYMDDWLTRARAAGTVPTAVFVCDYLMALTLLRVLRRQKLRVPEDISLVGFDDPLSAEHLTPALTTVRQPVSQMGRRAVERLLAGIRDGSPARGGELLRTELIVREFDRRCARGLTGRHRISSGIGKAEECRSPDIAWIVLSEAPHSRSL